MMNLKYLEIFLTQNCHWNNDNFYPKGKKGLTTFLGLKTGNISPNPDYSEMNTSRLRFS